MKSRQHSLQKHEVLNEILKRYSKTTPIHYKGLEILYNRAESRGYQSSDIYEGLIICIRKNYVRGEYVPPNNDPMQETIHERRYIEDWEFKQIFKTVWL